MSLHNEWKGRVTSLAIAFCMGSGVAEDMVIIPAGSFTMGDTFREGNSFERPTHLVYINTFYMDPCEVTKALWDSVHQWATSRGYGFNAARGKAPDHPANTVSWYDCAKWCNARSEKEGLTPCYYTSAARTTVYRTGDLDLSNNDVDWAANGYRLPTEAEWEKAARGGMAGRRFAWSYPDTIAQSRANYYSYWTDGHPYYAYDVNPSEGFHPAYAVGDTYTSPVGVFSANGYGLYDMSGNVLEWCWDWYDIQWYSNAGAMLFDTRGPATGSSRVKRGGSWGAYAFYCRVADRDNSAPGYINNVLGFRCVRGQAYSILPAIKVNASDTRVILHKGDMLSVQIELSTSTGMNADWWLVAVTPAGLYTCDAWSGQWFPFTNPAVLPPAYQGALFHFPAPCPIICMNTAILLAGDYTFYFGVDTVMDGVLDAPPALVYDSATLTITP